MNSRKKNLPSSSKRKQFLLKNGSALQQKLISTFGAKYKLPIHCFTAKDLIKATNNFSDHVFNHGDNVPVFEIIRGSLGGRSIVVAKHHCRFSIESEIEEYICNVAITSQLGHLKHVLKLVGCCLEFEYPVFVYENVCFRYLADFLYNPENGRLLKWRSRVKIAKEIAYTISYLHSAFPTPLIYQNLDPYTVIIDENGTPKLFDFSRSVFLPPGERQVELDMVRSNGYLDPNCFASFCITPKSDVYGIGVLLFVLITGLKATDTKGEENSVVEKVRNHFVDDQLRQIVDREIWELEDGDGKQLQLQALVELALRCIRENEEERPDMIDVTKELQRIENVA